MRRVIGRLPDGRQDWRDEGPATMAVGGYGNPRPLEEAPSKNERNREMTRLSRAKLREAKG